MINYTPRLRLPLLALIVVLCRNVEAAQRSTNVPCFTPQNRPGLCVSLKECKELTWLLINRRHDPKAIRYLKNSQCGYGENDPKVCCSSSSVITKPTVISNMEQCGSVDINQRIIGGDEAQLGEYPWMASLAYRKMRNRGPEWFCGGALISSRYVLTAAHCAIGISPWELYMVRVGDLNLNESVEDNATPQDIPVETVMVHEKYNQSPVINDIALIKLKYPAQITSFVKPICLPLYPEFRMKSWDNQNAVVAGWGRTALTGPFSSNLKDLDVPILNIDICKKAYSRRPGSYVDSRNLCAGYLNGEKDSCQGDSGGPLMWLNRTDDRFYVVGIVSYGFRCAERGYPGVYTKVSEYTDWISLNLQKF